jgi:beta-mannosidase
MGHGDYRFRNEKGQDVFEIFQKARNTAYSEFGCPGPSPVDYLQTFIPEEELWPPKPGTSWEDHHAFGAWAGDPSSWLMLPTLEHYFGKAGSLEELVAQGTWLQCAGYQAIYEEARRQKPACSMALSWCYNEPWPGAAGNSLVNWPAAPKKAYFAAQAACRPVLASARIPKFQWRAGETFTAEIWILNDAPGVSSGGDVEGSLLVGNAATPLVQWTFPALEPGRNLAGPTVEVTLPAAAAREFLLVLSVTPHKAWTSRYRLSLIGAD